MLLFLSVVLPSIGQISRINKHNISEVGTQGQQFLIYKKAELSDEMFC